MKNKYCVIIIAAAILIKIFLFAFAQVNAPRSKFLPDSTDYLETARVLSTQGVFAKQAEDGSLKYETLRTPGYPIFLAILNGLMKVPINVVVLFQVFLTIIAAFIVFR